MTEVTVTGKPAEDNEEERAAGAWLRVLIPELADVRLLKMTR